MPYGTAERRYDDAWQSIDDGVADLAAQMLDDPAAQRQLSGAIRDAIVGLLMEATRRLPPEVLDEKQRLIVQRMLFETPGPDDEQDDEPE